jgi:hypothetical protein
MKFLIRAPGLGAELPNEIRVVKCVGVFNLESREGNTQLWSMLDWGLSSRERFNLSKFYP